MNAIVRVVLFLAASLCFATDPGYAEIPSYDYDPATPGIQGPTHVLVAAPTLRAERQHQLVVRMCGNPSEVAQLVAPHSPIGSPACGGAPVVTFVFILNERRDDNGTITGPSSRMVAFVAGNHVTTGRVELLLTSSHPIIEFELEESDGVRSYVIEGEDATGATLRMDLEVSTVLSAFRDDPIRLTNGNPAPFRNLTTGVSFFIARAGYKATPPVSGVNVQFSFSKPASAFTFSTGAVSLGALVGNADIIAPTIYLIDFE